MSFLDEGSCLVALDCGGSPNTCIRVNQTDATNLRQSCSCGSVFSGQFCQLTTSVFETYKTIIPKIVTKIATFINKTRNELPVFRSIQDLQDYMTILSNT